MLAIQSREHLEIMKVKGYFILLGAPELELNYQMRFSV